ncbi:hypothetical protein WICMUC_003681 [Wickerhamomyces mucosus]|uniref:Cytidyltransferase-like domain-containing protein n=1 Tax=Wickerhamomyces mucosus TaxID=1378264 RepID=A0A9P8PLR8_9ASCO|nr:hypothetical protein WICMUC_003681 [Wickerhamomyces mucosus]
MSKNLISEQLKNFVQVSSSSFEVIHSTASFLPQKVFILDSSFNPPHKGHYALVTKYLEYYNSHSHNSSIRPSLLLLLSIKNADKTIPDPNVFVHRLEMIHLFSQYVEAEMKIDVSIGLTKHAKFIDKAFSIKERFRIPPEDKLTFLLGFDTLIRVFNPEYYKPLSLRDALRGFVESNEIFCLTRNDEIDMQFQFMNSISRDFPPVWSENIKLVHNEENALSISSSYIRNEVSFNRKGWEDLVFHSISSYIKENDLYLDILKQHF